MKQVLLLSTLFSALLFSSCSEEKEADKESKKATQEMSSEEKDAILKSEEKALELEQQIEAIETQEAELENALNDL